MKLEDSAPNPRRKAPYTAPKLYQFGEVGMVTRGVGGMLMDMGSMTKLMVMPSQGSVRNISSLSRTNITMGGMSDRSAQVNISRAATLPMGIGPYLFDYLDELRDQAGHGRLLGVMAAEVEGGMPEAVFKHASG